MIQNLKRRAMALPFMAGVRRHRALEKAVPVQFAEGFTIRTFPWVFDDQWEAAERREIARLMSACDLFVDVGANHGFYAAMADHLGKPCVAIEPEPANLAVLRANAEGRSIEVVPCAVGDSLGHINLYGDADTASLKANWQGERYFRRRVDVRTLDSILYGRHPDANLLIKVDVEGAEDAVLAGGCDVLRRPSTWMIETMPVTPAGEPSAAYESVFETMGRIGFAPRLIAGSKTNWLFER